MALSTFSCFYYGLKITPSNNKIDFNEGSGELTASVAVGSYSWSELVAAIKAAMDVVGTQSYTVSFNRSTRKVTISAASNFSLLTNTGTNVSVSPFSLLGYSIDADLSGTNTYTSTFLAGYAYFPQFILQDYQKPGTYIERIDPSVNESASGEIEVVSFGTLSYTEASFKFITDLEMDGSVIKNNPSGVQDAIDFFTSITERGKFEFMPDESDKSTFYVVVLEEVPGSRTGTGFRLQELVGQNLPGFFEINNVRMRILE